MTVFGEDLFGFVVDPEPLLACAYHETRKGLPYAVKAAIDRSHSFLSEVCYLPRMSHQTALVAPRKGVQGIACYVNARDFDVRWEPAEQSFQHSPGISLQFWEGASVAILRETIELCSVRHLLPLQVLPLRLSFYLHRDRLHSAFLGAECTDAQENLLPAERDREASVCFVKDHATQFFRFKVFFGLFCFFAYFLKTCVYFRVNPPLAVKF